MAKQPQATAESHAIEAPADAPGFLSLSEAVAAVQSQSVHNVETKDEEESDDQVNEEHDDLEEEDLEDDNDDQEDDDDVEPDDSAEDSDEEEDDSEDEDSEDEDTDEEPDARKRRYKVTVDGEERSVTLDELREGFQKGENFTQKTQELADYVKKVQGVESNAVEAQANYVQFLQEAQAKANQFFATEPDWAEIYDADPQLGRDLRELWKALDKDRQDQGKQLAKEQEKLEEAQKAEFQKYVAGEHEKVMAAVPEWKDKKRLDADRKAIKDWALDQGFSEQELTSVYDSRLTLLIRKAYLFDNMAKKKVSATKKKVAKAPKMSKSRRNRAGSVTPSARRVRNAGKQFDDNPNVDSAVDLLLANQQANRRANRR